MKSGLFDRRIIRHFDWGLLCSALSIPALGLIVLYSAGYDPDWTPSGMLLPFAVNSQAFLRQSLFFCLALGGMLFALAVNPQLLNRFAYWAYWIGIGLLIGVIFTGEYINGSRRWIHLGPGLNLQPAEVMKTVITLTMARYISRHLPRNGSYDFKQLFVPALIILLPMALIMDQPDLGSALSVGAIGASLLVFIGIRPRVIVTGILLFAVAAPFAWNQLHDYQQRRVLTLFNPEADPKGSGYHITQSIIAVGSGELTGKGYLKGTQTQLEFLPEHTTDFVFSVLAEEWGFFGCITLLGLYLTLIYRLLRVALRSKELFLTMVCFGVAANFALNVIINVGMVIGILPVVGIPLPLFSYGGSAMISMLFAIGLVLGISMRRFAYS